MILLHISQILREINSLVTSLLSQNSCQKCVRVHFRSLYSVYSHGQELFYKFVSDFTNKLVKQLLSMTVVLTHVNDCYIENAK